LLGPFVRRTCLLLLALAFASLLHLVTYALVANAIGGFASEWVGFLLRFVIRDPRHTDIAVDSLGEIAVAGLAVAGPLGAAFHQIAPHWFSSTPQSGDWATITLEPGTTLTASIAVALGTLGVLLGMGRLISHIAQRYRLRALIVAGLSMQVWAAVQFIRYPLPLADLNSAGLAALATKVFHLTNQDYQNAVRPLVALEDIGLPVVSASLLGVAAVLVYLAPHTLHGILSSGIRMVARVALSRVSSRRARPGPHAAATRAPLSVGLGLALLMTFPLPPPAQEGRLPGPLVFPIAGETRASAPASLRTSAAGSVTEAVGTHPQYQLRVDGSPFRIRGVGYNVYASKLGREERTAHYERDFRLMQQVGLNTVLGWEQSEFDEVLLDKAHEFGLRVILPFQLPPQVELVNYSDDGTRTNLLADIRAWARRFRDHPALLMYAPGNEVLTAMQSYFPQDRWQQGAYAAFCREMADAIHESDPAHPVILREAEVRYTGQLRQAFDDGKPRPWLLLGTNLYGSTRTFQRELAQRQELAWRLPGVITEFAPVGYRAADRPALITDMVRMTEEAGLLGWVLYAWTTDGPEPLDGTLGLVTGSGQPVDGTLRALELYLKENSAAR
jgi:hypothetical protein